MSGDLEFMRQLKQRLESGETLDIPPGFLERQKLKADLESEQKLNASLRAQQMKLEADAEDNEAYRLEREELGKAVLTLLRAARLVFRR